MHRTRFSSAAIAYALVGVIAMSSCASATMLNYVGAGGKLNLVIAETVGLGFGGGGHMLFGLDLGRAGGVKIYPNMEMWVGREDIEDPPNRELELVAFEATINFDARYYPPLPPSLVIEPFVGLGPAVVIDVREYDDPDWDDTDVGPGFNFLTGIDFPIGIHKMFGEFRGKVGDSWELVKFTVGVSFTIR
ncbi:MAG: hypothetical protein GF418_07235 [Chitinivibrionales bacterium]|nr:hypothetical protein [Chitinivibrionales bacterium]MBD3395405.1 hypothetical protein [Chitinivibrionales bacterium]